MIIGKFRYDAEHDVYAGEIVTLTLHRDNMVLRPNDKSSEKGPDYRIVQQREDGTVEFGAAWKRRGEQGREFLSIMLDDPALPSPLAAPAESDCSSIAFMAGKGFGAPHGGALARAFHGLTRGQAPIVCGREWHDDIVGSWRPPIADIPPSRACLCS
jgi:uncharacterized protein (DUF736 family)